MTPAQKQIKNLQKLSKQLSTSAGFFEDLGMESQTSQLDQAGEIVDDVLDLLQALTLTPAEYQVAHLQS